MKIENIKTLGELKAAGYQSKTIKEELRSNLREKIKTGKPTLKVFMVLKIR
jgi:magnesium chelatase subunit I